MRIRIIIDTEDADDPDVLAAQTPFTMNVYHDDDDRTPRHFPLDIDHSGCLVGNNIALMLRQLADAWDNAQVIDTDDEPLPNTGKQLRDMEKFHVV